MKTEKLLEGKTSLVKATFERNKLSWRDLSVAARPSRADFMGVPRKQPG